jgi:hypothetical protein
VSKVRDDRNGQKEMRGDVPNKMASMARVHNPAQCLGGIVRRILDAGDVKKNSLTGFFPILDSKVLDVNIMGARSGATRIHHLLDGGNIILKKLSWLSLWKAQLGKNGTQVLGNLDDSNSSDEFGFGRAGCSSRLGLGTTGNDTTGNGKGIAGSRTTLAKFVGIISRIDIPNKLRGHCTNGCDYIGLIK